MSGIANVERVGFFGKAPALGDFVQRGLSSTFIEHWDAWLRRMSAGSRAELGEKWLPAYLECPPWRFALAAGTVGSAVCAGVLMPSLDRVDREFPLTLAGEWPAGVSPIALAIDGACWFDALERFALEMLDTRALDPDEVLARLNGIRAPTGRVLFHCDSHWSGEIGVDADLARGLLASLESRAEHELAPVTAWWTGGPGTSQGRWCIRRGLPGAADVSAVLRAYASAERFGTGVHRPPPAPMKCDGRKKVSWRSAAVSHVGRVRSSNQDALLARDALGIWIVADGMGGHRHGEYASRCVANAVASAVDGRDGNEPRLARVRDALQRANTELRTRGRADLEFAGAGSTVVAAVVDGASATLLWAGDSRAYMWRRGRLAQLTTDHSWAASGARFAHEITRAVGGADALELEELDVDLEPGDRLLLCSDGVHGVMQEDALETLMDSSRPPDAVCAAIERAVLAGTAPDNFTAVVVEIRACD